MIIQKIKNQVRKIPMATRLWNCIYRALEVNRKEIINWDVRESRKILESLRKIQKNEEKETLVTRLYLSTQN
ncbi:MAG: hypothetical protein PHX08_24570 [Lachnospiraceae bacterium]|nr:hypothetical protein [Lachnospiraceae bacterium]